MHARTASSARREAAPRSGASAPASPRRRRRRILLLAFGLVAGGAPQAGAGPQAPLPRLAPGHLEPLSGFAERGEAWALAVARDGRIALGDDAGVRLGRPPRGARRVLRRGPVRDLAFGPQGTLLAATGRGLFAITTEGEVQELSTGPGEAARSARRVLAGGRLWGVATDAGVFAGPPGGPLRRLDASLPAGAATAVALAPGADAPAVLHALLGEEVWRAELANGRDGWRVVRAERLVLEGLSGTPRDLIHSARHGLLVLTARDVAASPTGGRLRPLRLDLPPGAEPERLLETAGRLWIAGPSGLLALHLGEDPQGPDGASGPEDAGGEGARAERAPAPLGRIPVHDVALAEAGLVVASARGARLVPRAPASAAASEAAASPAPRRPALPSFHHEPSVQAVHRVALRWLGLEAEHVADMRSRVRRRGWLPYLELRGGYDGDRSRGWRHDEAYTGGDYRKLHDRDGDRGRGFDVSAVLRWTFGDVAFEPEEIDVSREARLVIQLRDEVLDEINQLYHERRRVLREAARLAPDDPEAARLRSRAAELAAGLDGWTGGWWSRRLREAGAPAASSSPARSPETIQP